MRLNRFFIPSLLVLLSHVVAAGDIVVPPRNWSPGGNATQISGAGISSIAPAPSLDREQIPAFNAGRALAHQPWVKAPTTTTARDGLGPLYNARTCLRCHVNGGRGRYPDNGSLVGSAVVRLGMPGEDAIGGVIDDPVYGDQIQVQSVSLADQLGLAPSAVGEGAAKEPPAEAKVHLSWESHDFVYPDGTMITLRRPQPVVSQFGYGELHRDTVITLRNAPVVHGAGLVSLIPEGLLTEWADPDDNNGDGISGRFNTVWNRERGAAQAGRFGWKANSPDLRHTVAGAFVNDIGIVNSLFPEETCTEAQPRCRGATSGRDQPSGLELPDDLLQLVVEFIANAAVPAARPLPAAEHQAGGQLFLDAGCAACHRPRLETGESEQYPHLASQEIWPFSDFLLHDMGRGLADGRPDFEASGTEWRTAPLWGLGVSAQVNGSTALLHDGRADGVESAILWHGGEAATAKDRFAKLPADQRALLVRYVESL